MSHDLDEEPAADAPHPNASIRVLVVDDIAENRSALCRRLERMGYSFAATDCGKSALSLIETERPDIVLLDYMMPDMSGVEVVRELREHTEFADLPVIMVTARTDPESVVESLAAGANDYVTKPIDFKSLGARMSAQLSRNAQSKVLKETNTDLDWKATSRAMELDDMQEQLNAVQKQNELLAKRLENQAEGDRIVDGNASPPSTSAMEESGGASVNMDVVLPRIKRIEMLATRLSTLPSGGNANPAILAEIASLARTTLRDIEGPDEGSNAA